MFLTKRLSPFLDETSDDTEGVVDGSGGLLEHEFIGASHYDRHCLAGVRNPCHLWGQHSFDYVEIRNI